MYDSVGYLCFFSGRRRGACHASIGDGGELAVTIAGAAVDRAAVDIADTGTRR